MSYCRFSSDFFQCDVYCYESVKHDDGTNNPLLIVHVAHTRFKHTLPDEIKAMYPKDMSDPSFVDQYMRADRAEYDWRRQFSTSEPVGSYCLPDEEHFLDLKTIGEEAGETFQFESYIECAEFLEKLKTKGFLVPDYAITALME